MLRNKEFERPIVKFVSEGPAGHVYYSESGETLPFYWQQRPRGFDVYLPSTIEWEGFCEKHKALSAKERREEIVRVLVQELLRTQARGAKVIIYSYAITFSYEGSILHKLFEKLLGVD